MTMKSRYDTVNLYEDTQNRCHIAHLRGWAMSYGVSFVRTNLNIYISHYTKLSRAMRAPWVDRFLNNEIYCYPLSKKQCRPLLRSPPTRRSEGIVILVLAATLCMVKCKTAVSPLLMHWRYCSLALSPRYMFHLPCCCEMVNLFHCELQQDPELCQAYLRHFNICTRSIGKPQL